MGKIDLKNILINEIDIWQAFNYVRQIEHALANIKPFISRIHQLYRLGYYQPDHQEDERTNPKAESSSDNGGK